MVENKTYVKLQLKCMVDSRVVSQETGENEEIKKAQYFSKGAVVLRSLIIKALDQFKQGQREEFDSHVQILGDANLKPAHLRRYLEALRGCISHLTKEFDTLVGTALAVDWAGQDDETVDEFLEFLTSLVSAQTYYLRACLRMLVKSLLPRIPKDGNLNIINLEEQDRRFFNVHEGLKAVVNIVPIAPKFLLPVLADCFPYIKKPTIFLQSYAKNLLTMIHYVPSIREDILEVLVDHITRLDVEVPKHELEHINIEQEEDDQTQFEVDLENQNNEENSAKEVGLNHEMADKLDIMMDMIFNYIYEVCHPNGEYNVDAANELFNDLLMIFEKVILPTYASCHVQFILFKMCSLDQVFTNELLDLCWKKIENPNTPAILRQASAAYVASLIARAKYIQVGTVKTCLTLFVHWIHNYIDLHDASCNGPNAAMYGPFYSVCQAVFYIFVFKHKQLIELEEGLKFIRKLHFERIITCRLNPLKVCLPAAVKMFATVTRMYEIVFCYTIIERNNRCLVPVTTASSGSNRAVSHLSSINQLDSFFPFDPYLLKRSSKYIHPLYQQWEGLGPDLEEEDLETKQLDSDDDEDEYHEYGRTPDAAVPSIGAESPQMLSGSPGFLISPMDHDWSLVHDSNLKMKHNS